MSVALLLLCACGNDRKGAQSSPESGVGEQVDASTPPSEGPVAVAVWVTTEDQTKLLERQADVLFEASQAALTRLTTVDINPAVKYQTMDGFGASLSDSSAWLLGSFLPQDKRSEVMEKLFSVSRGAGLSNLRHVIGASDFSLTNYTYNDLPLGETDPAQERFSIEHDRAYILPVLNQAKQINPALLLFAAPWSPPAWMKTSESLLGGELRPEARDALASYLLKFVREFEAEGLPVYALAFQNEPFHLPETYPGMFVSAQDQATFIAGYLGPLFAREKIKTKLLVLDHNWEYLPQTLAILDEPRVREYVAGTAFHCYAGDFEVQNEVHARFPDLGIWMTECTASLGSAFGPDLRYDMSRLFIGSVRAWSRSVMKWNLALDEDGGPNNGGCRSCRGVVTINQSNGSVHYNEEYYALGHATRAAQVGARRIESNSFAGGIENVAFENPDGTTAVLVLNAAEEPRRFEIRTGASSFTYELPPGAVATFRWPAADIEPPIENQSVP